MAPMRFPVLLVTAAIAALLFAVLMWPGPTPSDTPVAPGPDAPPSVEAQALPTVGGPARELVTTVDGQQIDPHLAIVHVLVRSETDEPLPGCRIKLGEADARLSGDDGGAEIALAPGRQWLDVQPADANRNPTRQRLTAVGGRRVEAVVTLTARSVPDFWCRIVMASGQQPIAGARLATQPSADGESISGEDGVVQVPVGGDSEYVRVVAPGFGPRRIVPDGAHATAERALDVPLEQAAVLELTVVDAAEHPVGDVDVSITAMPWSLRWPATAPVRGGPEIWTERLEDDGVGTIGELPANCPLFVTVTPPPGTASPGTVTWQLMSGNNQKRLQLQPLGGLRGRVLDPGGRPVAAAHLVALKAVGANAVELLPDQAAGESVMTGEDGSYELDGLTPGAWLVGLQHTDGWSAPCRRVEVPPGSSVQFDLRAVAALSIRGRLLGPDNLPISAFEVHALRNGMIIASAVTEKDGSYELQSLSPGEYDIFTELYQGELAMVAPVRCSAGRTNVDIKVASVLATLRGHATAPPRGGDLWLRGLRRDGAEFCGGRCDLDGRFEQPRQREGLWDLSVTDAHGNVGVLHGVQLVAGRTTPDLEIVLQPGAIVRPVHPSADAYRIERGVDIAARDALERGLPGEAHVPPGEWTVVFLRGGFELGRHPITIAAGEQQMVGGS